MKLKRSKLANLAKILLMTTIVAYFAASLYLFDIGHCSSAEFDGLIRHKIDSIQDGDGLEIADFDDDGDTDIVIAESKLGKVSWYEQTTDLESWTKHFIAEGYTKIEGLEAFDVLGDGKTEVFILDQSTGHIDMARQTSADPTSTWQTITLTSNAKYIQSALDWDVDEDGDVDLLYAFEGNEAGDGGLYWLEFLGGDLMNPNNWTTHELAQIDGGWWIAENILDIDEDGNSTDIIMTARALRNPSADAGIYWIKPKGSLRNPWNITIIDDNSEYAPLHVTTGNLTGGTTRNDIAAGAMDSGSGVYIYNSSDNFSRSTLRPDGRWHNVKAADLDGKGQDELILVDNEWYFGYRMWVYSHQRDVNGNNYAREWSDYYWKADDRIIPHDLNLDGVNEVITVSAMDNSVDWWEVAFKNTLREKLILPRWWGTLALGIIISMVVVLFITIYKKKQNSK